MHITNEEGMMMAAIRDCTGGIRGYIYENGGETVFTDQFGSVIRNLPIVQSIARLWMAGLYRSIAAEMAAVTGNAKNVENNV